jgi:hypothetical protein
MDNPRFFIRYWQRTSDDALVLLVEDDCGRLLLCTGQRLRRFLHEAYDPARRAETLRALGWMPVPEVAPYTLAALQGLLPAEAVA